ncbi:Nitrous oxide-stimulated promoter [Desulfoscipio geothermicus DSM 3669]|uniref:Nitrous oxide-stimulated promoter n=1 Tax=Desulfoscipio geothermicus DSM 3669 TaxID=1121426 RepID=A0A1I6DLR8_9FIRM|nr:nitrous oxide-stimulated promoter family protein [Desulfoscipio geothermicus]SFR06331.1 Nitrous oxide-stimulated promoter [Desulfoscipio geothermicus DSM 3669]
MQLKNSIEIEKDTVKKMIHLYCKSKHGFKKQLCQDCQALLEYATERLEACKFGNAKPTCEKCTIHCYRPDMRDKVKKVMRFSGLRMIFVHPLKAARHMLKNIRS